LEFCFEPLKFAEKLDVTLEFAGTEPPVFLEEVSVVGRGCGRGGWYHNKYF
jgi:hypothetical protein